MNTVKIFKTEDGSHTLFNEKKNEYYHSIHGAVQESKHIFINAGLKFKLSQKESINILEIGLGTGLNVILTLMHLNSANAITSDSILKSKIKYHAIEPYPLPQETAIQLNYCEFLDVPHLKDIFSQIHCVPKGCEISLTETFDFARYLIPFQEYNNMETKYDLVYFDAFSPEVEPGLWAKAIFSKLASIMVPEGVLVTYCSKGVVRRTMQSCNFNTERLKGPPGKHEMLRAIAMP